MVFIINTLLPSILKKNQAYTTSKIHTQPQNKLLLGSQKDAGCLTHVPFLCLFYSTTAPSSLHQPASSRAKITISNISTNRLTKQPKGNTEKRG